MDREAWRLQSMGSQGVKHDQAHIHSKELKGLQMAMVERIRKQATVSKKSDCKK